jgi:hypothetical protein
MEKISHSVRKVKQAKNLLTVQSIQSVRTLTWHVHTLMWHVRTLTWHVRTDDTRQVRTDDMAIPDGDTWRLQEATRDRQFWTFWRTVGPIRR